MAHCHAQGSLPSQLDQERVRALRDRIQSDKRQLQKLESKIRKHELLYETRTSHPVAPPPRHGLESTVIRDNPIFNDHVYDAMDAYMHDEPHKSRRNVQSLYRECQRRIQAAESLLEQASAEVCHPSTIIIIWVLCSVFYIRIILQQSIRKEIASLRECIELCLEEIQQRHEADTKLSGMFVSLFVW